MGVNLVGSLVEPLVQDRVQKDRTRAKVPAQSRLRCAVGLYGTQNSLRSSQWQL